MLKLRLDHTWRKLENGQTDYHSQMIEFDYSHLNEERRDVVTHEFEYEGKKSSTSETYVTFGRGLVLEYASHYIGDGDSVGSVAVWDPIEKKPVWFGLGYENGVYSDGTRLGPNQFITYDATPEVKAEWEAYKAAEKAKADQERKRAEAARAKWEAEQEAAAPKPGRKVIVIKGRKVAKGTTGKVFWHGQTLYGRRVGIVLADGSKVFTAADNVEVVDNLKMLERLSELQETGGR